MTEHDPTAIDPDEPHEDDLPDKPSIDIPSEPVAPPTDQEEQDVPDDDFLDSEVVKDDPTIDDQESEEGQ